MFKIEVDSHNFTAPASYEVKVSDIGRSQSARTKSGSPRHKAGECATQLSQYLLRTMGVVYFLFYFRHHGYDFYPYNLFV